jgi:glutamate synthase domain-containing protein 2
VTTYLLAGAGATIVVLALIDLLQRAHAIRRNFPFVGRFRYLLESVGPEIRQYFISGNNDERPFSRNQRRWIYASSKGQNNYFGFGSDNEQEASPSYTIVRPAVFPISSPLPGDEGFDPSYPLPALKLLGGFAGRRKAFLPASALNLSGMSFGALSGAAVEAINRGVAIAGCLQNTGEGGLSPHHLHGGDLVFQLGTGYFGCRERDGQFSLTRLMALTDEHRAIRAIEIKLSQGAKPGIGGVLPRAKLTAEIAAIRGVSLDRDCVSPAAHTAFRDADSLLDFVETIAAATGLPVGIKSAVGELTFWRTLAKLMTTTERSVDFITIDGGEGGTGAAPLVFADHVGLPFKIGFSRVQQVFAEHELHDRVTFIGSGKLGFPDAALVAFALGCDMINVGREALLSIGCIQALSCHTNRCPTGITTQSPWLSRGLDPELKAVRLANYIVTLRKELLALSHACGATHPSLVSASEIEMIDDRFGSQTLAALLGGRGHGIAAPRGPSIAPPAPEIARLTLTPISSHRDH